MKIAMFASEMDPFIKTGGLADVIGSLPQALATQVDQIDVFLPYYRDIKRKNLQVERVSYKIKIKIGSQTYNGNVFRLKTNLTNLSIYFIDNYRLFRQRAQLYVKNGRDYRDNLERFVFFCQGALRTIIDQWSTTSYDVFHMHDWQTALIGLYAKISRFFQKNALPLRVFTIHNLAYQGKFPRSHFHKLGIDNSYFHPERLEFWGKINLMKAGLLYCDIITTVSPTYAKEIQTDKYGSGLGHLINEKSTRLYGILNGVDYQVWNPKTDPYIAANYSENDLSGKLICKTRLQQTFQLQQDQSIPILCVVSRLVWQKGMDLVLKVLPKFLKREIQFILLGTGEPGLEKQFNKLSKEFPNKTGIALTFNDQLAHQIEAGSDIFLMPSRYEPCGLNDKYSLKYGTIPIVNRTGGLADSVIDYIKDPKEGTGFVFDSFDEKRFENAIKYALRVFNMKSEWHTLMKRGMEKDFSWSKAAEEYLKLYQKSI
ncbi:MAG: glycogen synthase GlgA [Candidatus Hodarchaeota archaeon]